MARAEARRWVFVTAGLVAILVLVGFGSALFQQRTAPETPAPVESTRDVKVVHIVPIHFASADSIARAVRDEFLRSSGDEARTPSSELTIESDPKTNTLLLQASADEIDSILQRIETLDALERVDRG